MKTSSLLLAVLTLSGALVAANAWAGEGSEAVTKAQLRHGRLIFQQTCFSCHQINGQGIPGVYPPLADSDLILNHRGRAIDVLIHGLQGPIKVKGKTYNNVMPDLHLTNHQIADVLTYVSNSWGNNEGPVAEKLVAKERKALAESSKRYPSNTPQFQSNGTSCGGMMGRGMMSGGS